MASPYGPSIPDCRSTSTAWATAVGYFAMSAPCSIGACEVLSVMPLMPAASYPWKTVTFSPMAICRTASSSSSRSMSVAPRSASSSCTRETLNSARSSTRGRTLRWAAATPSDGPEMVAIRPRLVAECDQP